MKVIIAPRAARDIEEIWLFIARDSVDAADRMQERLEKAARMFGDQPHAGRQRDEFDEEIRSFAVGSYVLYYWIRGETVEVVRVIHGARDVKNLFDN